MPRRKPGALLGGEIAILGALKRGEAHAYELGSDLDQERSTISRALVRLEIMGHTESDWRLSRGRARRVYRLTRKGRAALKAAEG